MFCPKCGNDVKNGAQFCPKCGEKMRVNTGSTKKAEKKDAYPLHGSARRFP